MALSRHERWDRFRSQMPVTKHWAYFDHAAVAALPSGAHDAIAKWLKQASDDGGPAWMDWEDKLNRVRNTTAAMVGAAQEEIGLIKSTTEGVTCVAEGFPWQPGDNVVLPADEFPSNQYPWMNLASRGVEVRRVAADGVGIDLDRLAVTCDDRTKIVALSWVGFLSGWRADLDAAAEIAHRRGALLFVDVIQGLGAFPLDVRQAQIDFFAADGHKWMLGPEGAGVMYIRREHLDKLRPFGLGWNSVAQGSNFTQIELKLKNSAQRYEGGSPNSVGFAGLSASLELLNEIGIDAIGRRLLEITALCCERLIDIGAVIVSRRQHDQNCSGIVTFEFPGCNSLAMKKHCLAKHVLISHRSGKLRISPHAYINDDDIDRLIAALSEAKPICRAS